MKKSVLLSISATFFYCTSVQAQKIYQQENTVVTASRYSQAETDVIPSMTVINRQDILNLQANNILDILSLQQGIDVARTGGQGSQTSVFMRGTNSNHTLVLIDGIRASSSFTGTFAWEHLPISQVERIEIVRGTRVSYYGSDAIGGVINIITRKQNNLYVRYTAGSYDTHNIDVGYGKTTEKNQYSIVLGSYKTDGFSATNENNAFSFNPDKDGSENLSININVNHQLDNGKLTFNLLEASGDVDFDSGNSDSKERILGLAWHNEIFNGWNSKLSIGNNFNEIKTQAFSSDFNSKRYSLDWLLNKQIEQNHYAYGITYRKEQADFLNIHANEVSFSDSRNNIALFANWKRMFTSTILSSSLRYDDNSVYGSDFSMDIDWAYNFTNNTRLNFSAGSAFHAPSINELFSPNFQGLVTSPITGGTSFAFSFEGNPNLKPEESTNYEIGLKTQMNDNQNLSFNMFYYKIDNLIDFQGFTFKPVNVNEASIKGLEAQYQYSYNNLNLNINATIQDANNDETDTPLLRRPDNKLNLSIDKFFNNISVGSSIRYASNNPDFGVEVDGYTVIDLRAAYKFNEHWKVSAKIENATDKDYQVINGYNTPDLSGYLTIQWQQ